jgi:peroxiredoxin
MRITRKLKLAILAVSVLAVVGRLETGCTPAPEVPSKAGGLSIGDKAYPFSLPDSNGNILKLSDTQEGWYLVLVFYRGHWCGACLNQLLNLKDDYGKFTPARAGVAAISVDPMEDSAHFTEQWRFPFPLLSDTQLQAIDAYGLRHAQGHDGKDISRPAVVIIDPQKIIRYKYVGQNPTDRPSDDEILFEIQKLQQEAKKH